jgi:hypothetical protein
MTTISTSPTPQTLVTFRSILLRIDKEVEVAKGRAQEAAGEYEALRGSAKERKDAITERLEALK